MSRLAWLKDWSQLLGKQKCIAWRRRIIRVQHQNGDIQPVVMAIRFPRIGAQANVDRRVFCPEPVQSRDQPAHSHRAQTGDIKGRAARLIEGQQSRVDLIKSNSQGLCKEPAIIGQNALSPRTDKQIKTQHGLKFRDLAADRTRSDGKFLCCKAHAFVTRDGFKGLERVERNLRAGLHLRKTHILSAKNSLLHLRQNGYSVVEHHKERANDANGSYSRQIRHDT
jgi:hypothetical protein